MQSKTNVVISCGGGTPIRECNVVEMKKNGRVVLLTAKPETILDRVKDLSLIHIYSRIFFIDFLFKSIIFLLIS